jgi:hypothetical protein
VVVVCHRSRWKYSFFLLLRRRLDGWSLAFRAISPRDGVFCDATTRGTAFFETNAVHEVDVSTPVSLLASEANSRTISLCFLSIFVVVVVCLGGRGTFFDTIVLRAFLRISMSWHVAAPAVSLVAVEGFWHIPITITY